MENLTPNPQWDDVPQLETTTVELGGAGGAVTQTASKPTGVTDRYRSRPDHDERGGAGRGARVLGEVGRDRVMEDQNAPGMWHHYCPAEQTCLGVAAGQPCNWCDTKEPREADLRDDLTDPIKGD